MQKYCISSRIDYICLIIEVLTKWEKLKEERNLVYPPEKKKIKKSESKNKLNQILNKYPYFPYILGFSLLTILIIDLVNYYK